MVLRQASLRQGGSTVSRTMEPARGMRDRSFSRLVEPPRTADEYPASDGSEAEILAKNLSLAERFADRPSTRAPTRWPNHLGESTAASRPEPFVRRPPALQRLQLRHRPPLQ